MGTTTAREPRSLHEWERRKDALLIAATERATALAFRALPALFTIRPACELLAALARRLTRRPR